MELKMAQVKEHGPESAKNLVGDGVLRKADIQSKSSAAGAQQDELDEIIKNKLVNEDEIQRKLRSGN